MHRDRGHRHRRRASRPACRCWRSRRRSRTCPGGHAARPGDIVRALNGTWVDITNTDAEGRLILGDAMTYAEQLGATHLVDVATLTGAVGRALGNLVTGVFATPDPWWDEVAAAAERAGERYWRLPLVAGLPVRDGQLVRRPHRTRARAEGSLVKSGLFLEQFRTVPWAHLDIGGTAYFRKAYPFAARGANGVTHRDAGRAGARRRRLTRRRADRGRLRATPGYAPCRPAARRSPLALSRWWRAGGSPRTGSPSAGPSTTRTTARRAPGWRTLVAVLTGARWRWARVPLRLRRTAAGAVGRSAPTSRRWCCCWRPTSTSGCCPNVITLPAIPLALVFDLAGRQPARPAGGSADRRSSWRVVVPLVLFALSIPFGAGAFGLGDVKLLVSVGLLAGPWRLISGVDRTACCSPAS